MIKHAQEIVNAARSLAAMTAGRLEAWGRKPNEYDVTDPAPQPDLPLPEDLTPHFEAVGLPVAIAAQMNEVYQREATALRLHSIRSFQDTVMELQRVGGLSQSSHVHLLLGACRRQYMAQLDTMKAKVGSMVEAWVQSGTVIEESREEVFDEEILRILEASFNCRQKNLTAAERALISRSTGLSQRQIVVWFQNRRQRGRPRAAAQDVGSSSEVDGANLPSPKPAQRQHQLHLPLSSLPIPSGSLAGSKRTRSPSSNAGSGRKRRRRRLTQEADEDDGDAVAARSGNAVPSSAPRRRAQKPGGFSTSRTTAEQSREHDRSPRERVQDDVEAEFTGPYTGFWTTPQVGAGSDTNSITDNSSSSPQAASVSRSIAPIPNRRRPTQVRSATVSPDVDMECDDYEDETSSMRLPSLTYSIFSVADSISSLEPDSPMDDVPTPLTPDELYSLDSEIFKPTSKNVDDMSALETYIPSWAMSDPSMFSSDILDSLALPSFPSHDYGSMDILESAQQPRRMSYNSIWDALATLPTGVQEPFAALEPYVALDGNVSLPPVREPQVIDLTGEADDMADYLELPSSPPSSLFDEPLVDFEEADEPLPLQQANETAEQHPAKEAEAALDAPVEAAATTLPDSEQAAVEVGDAAASTSSVEATPAKPLYAARSFPCTPEMGRSPGSPGCADELRTPASIVDAEGRRLSLLESSETAETAVPTKSDAPPAPIDDVFTQPPSVTETVTRTVSARVVPKWLRNCS